MYRLGFILFILQLLLIGNAFADQRELKTDAKDKVDAVLVIDASGSMRLTDPQKLRYEGAELFANLLNVGDRLGIVAFDDTARVLRPLTDFNTNQKAEIRGAIESAGDAGEFTNILSGISEAISMIRASPRSDASPLIVLLSDGKMESSKGDAEGLTTELLERTAPELRQEGIKVYTLAFSDLVDKDLLSQLAATTGAVNWFTPDASKIHESYADLFLAVKKPQVVPLTKKGFKIDKDVSEATFYIDRTSATSDDIYLISPLGQHISINSLPSGARWFQGQKFDVVTLIKPQAGDWQISGVDANEGFATVLTNLKLITDWPTSFNAGDPVLLQARLYEGEKPVVLPEMTASGQYAFQIVSSDQIAEPIIRELLVDDGTAGDQIPNDGIFSRSVHIENPGEYRVRILAKAPTFERNQQIPFRVRPRLVTLSVVEASSHQPQASGGHSEEHDEHGAAESGGGHAAPEGKSDFLISLSQETDSFRNLQVKCYAVDGEKKKFILIPRKYGEREYRISTMQLPHEGNYKIQAELSGEMKNKKAITASSTVLEYVHTIHAETEKAIEIVEKEPEKPVGDNPIIPAILLLIFAAIGSGAGFKILKQAVAGGAVTFPELPPLAKLTEGVALLESIAARSDMDLSDPRIFPAEGAETTEKSESKKESKPPQAESPSEDSQSAPSENQGEA